MSQYITLPRNSSLSFFLQNNLTSFNTKLAKSIIPDDHNWEVALAEISFPKSWINVIEGENKIYVEDNQCIRCLTIPVKRYSNNFEFYHALKEMFTLEKQLGISVHFNERTGHMIFESPKQTVIFLSGKLALQIGFESDAIFNM